MSYKTVLLPYILEKTTAKLEALIVDEAGVAISSANLDTLILDLYDMTTTAKTIINARSAQNVLNINDVSVDTSGNLIWLIQDLDTIILDATLATETHRAVLSWTYSAGTKTGRAVLDMTIVNLAKVA